MQILIHLLLTEGLSFRHTGWHSTQLQPSSTHPSPHRSQDNASAARGQGLCAHSGPQQLRTGVGVRNVPLQPCCSCPPALARAARHGPQQRGCRPGIPQVTAPRPAAAGTNPSRSRPPEQGALSSRAVGTPGAHASLRHRNTRAGAEPHHRSSRAASAAQKQSGPGLRLTGDTQGRGQGAEPALRGRERQRCCPGRARRVRFQRSNPKPAHPERRSKASSLHRHRGLDLI